MTLGGYNKMITFSFNSSGITYERPSRNKGKNLTALPETYCVIDIETTGLSPDFDSIIEVSGIKYDHGKQIAEFSSLI